MQMISLSRKISFVEEDIKVIYQEMMTLKQLSEFRSFRRVRNSRENEDKRAISPIKEHEERYDN